MNNQIEIAILKRMINLKKKGYAIHISEMGRFYKEPRGKYKPNWRETNRFIKKYSNLGWIGEINKIGWYTITLIGIENI